MNKLEEIIGKYIDGEMSAPEKRALSEWLKASEKNRREFISFVKMDSFLAATMNGEAADETTLNGIGKAIGIPDAKSSHDRKLVLAGVNKAIIGDAHLKPEIGEKTFIRGLHPQFANFARVILRIAALIGIILLIAFISKNATAIVASIFNPKHDAVAAANPPQKDVPAKADKQSHETMDMDDSLLLKSVNKLFKGSNSDEE